MVESTKLTPLRPTITCRPPARSASLSACSNCAAFDRSNSPSRMSTRACSPAGWGAEGALLGHCSSLRWRLVLNRRVIPSDWRRSHRGLCGPRRTDARPTGSKAARRARRNRGCAAQPESRCDRTPVGGGDLCPPFSRASAPAASSDRPRHPPAHQPATIGFRASAAPFVVPALPWHGSAQSPLERAIITHLTAVGATRLEV
jgi:hypothetical protein